MALPACAGLGPPTETDFRGASTTELVAPFDDFHAALMTATHRFEMAVLDEQTPEPGTHVFHLVTVLDEPVVLRAKRTAPTAPASPETAPDEYEITLRFGLWGNPEREREIMALIRSRLAELARKHRRPRTPAKPAPSATAR